MLFIVYINFVVFSLPCNLNFFADEIKLYFASDSLSPTSNDFAIVQTNIDQLRKSFCRLLTYDECRQMCCYEICSKILNSLILSTFGYKSYDSYVKFVNCLSDLGVY